MNNIIFATRLGLTLIAPCCFMVDVHLSISKWLFMLPDSHRPTSHQLTRQNVFPLQFIVFIMITPNGNYRQLGLENCKLCVLIVICLNAVDMTLRKPSEEVTHGLVMTSPPLPVDCFTRLSGFVTEICWETENRLSFALSVITSTRNRSFLRTMFLRNSAWDEAVALLPDSSTM